MKTSFDILYISSQLKYTVHPPTSVRGSSSYFDCFFYSTLMNHPNLISDFHKYSRMYDKEKLHFLPLLKYKHSMDCSDNLENR
mmetsp:Transcript_5876/g.8582  ORF Transcript_5876/g.8582 Transcript_5876/m.8582 type:complete len:83 (+) Transcript_5876:240-488(+)